MGGGRHTIALVAMGLCGAGFYACFGIDGGLLRLDKVARVELRAVYGVLDLRNEGARSQ